MNSTSSSDATAVRADKRSPTSIRNFDAKVSTNPSVSGSAYVELGITKVIASVFGPREVSRGATPGFDYSTAASLGCDFKYAPFAKLHLIDPKTGRHMMVDRTPETQDLERLNAETVSRALSPAVVLERYPKSAIEVAILVLQSDGGELPACLMAASLALADAGVEMHGLVAAISVGNTTTATTTTTASSDSKEDVVVSSPPFFAVDLSGSEEGRASSLTTVAYCRALDKITLLNHRGASSSSTSLVGDIGFALESCAVLERAMKQTLKNAEARKLVAAQQRGMKQQQEGAAAASKATSAAAP